LAVAETGVEGARAVGPEGDHPACTERRNDVEEGWGNRPGRASEIPWAARGQRP